MVMSDANSHTCLRVEVGPKFTSFVSHERKGVNLEKLPNDQFDKRFIWEWTEHAPEKFAATMFKLLDYGVIVTRRARAHLTLFYKEPQMAAPTPAATAPVKVAPTPKVVAPKAEGEVTKRGKRIENQKIKVLVKDNPKRPSSNAFQIFSLYATYKTTDEFLAAGGTSAALRYDVEHEFIELY
jgi:hypothetical protein